MHKPDTQIQVPLMTRERQVTLSCDEIKALLPEGFPGYTVQQTMQLEDAALTKLRSALDQEDTEVQQEGRRWLWDDEAEDLYPYRPNREMPVDAEQLMPVSEHTAALQEVEAERASLHGELATLLGPRTPREGVTANDHWIAAVGKLLGEQEAAEARALSAEEGLAKMRGVTPALMSALSALRYITGQDVAGMEGHQRAPDVAAAALGEIEALFPAALSNHEGREGCQEHGKPDCEDCYVEALTEGREAVKPGWLDRSLERASQRIEERPEHLKPARHREGREGSETCGTCGGLRTVGTEPCPDCSPKDSPPVSEREYRVNAHDGIYGPFADADSALYELGEHQRGYDEDGGPRPPELESRAVGPWEEGRFGSPPVPGEAEELTMIALALRNHGIENCTPEEGVERLIQQSYLRRIVVNRKSPVSGGGGVGEAATVPASEYDALADSFRDFVAEATMTPASEVGVMELGEHLHDYADEEYAFLAQALKQGSRALTTRREPATPLPEPSGDSGGGEQ